MTTDTMPMERQITITRVFDAPRDTVFEYWTQAEHLKQWWGPEGFTITQARADARPGGELFVVMKGPDGVESPVNGEFVEVTPPERVVQKTWVTGEDGARILEAVETAIFTDLGGDRTELTLHATGTAFVDMAAAMLSGMYAGWNQSLQCLDDVLRGITDRQLVLMRMFEAPIERVFDAFCDREHIGEWFGPEGFSLTIEEMDVRPGGTWRFTMHGPDGTDYANHVTYDEVERPVRLRYTHNEERPFQVTITFDEFMGNTVLTLRSVFPTVEEMRYQVETVHAIEGGNQTLDRLGAYLQT